MTPSIRSYLELLNAQPWVFPLVVVLLVFVFNQVVRRLLRARLRRVQPAQGMWRHAVLSSIGAPASALTWLLGAVLLKERLSPAGALPLLDRFYGPVLGVAVILVLTWFLLRLAEHAKANYVAHHTAHNGPVDYTAVDAVSKLAQALVLVFAVISVLQQLQVPLASLLAFGGAAGIAVGFASQTLVANLFGGLTVYASRIFKIGEEIIFPGTPLAGMVEQIGWRSTRVRGWDGKPFYVPNSVFNSSNMVNHSRLTHRTISEHLLLGYRDLDKVEPLVQAAQQMLADHEEVGYFVFRFDQFGDGALKLILYAWVRTTPAGGFLSYADFMRIKQELLLAIAAIAGDLGCELMQPISNVHLHGAVTLPGATAPSGSEVAGPGTPHPIQDAAAASPGAARP